VSALLSAAVQNVQQGRCHKIFNDVNDVSSIQKVSISKLKINLSNNNNS